MLQRALEKVQGLFKTSQCGRKDLDAAIPSRMPNPFLTSQRRHSHGPRNWQTHLTNSTCFELCRSDPSSNIF